MHRAFTRPIGRARTRAAVPAVLLLVAGLFAGAVAASPSGAAPPPRDVQTTELVVSNLTTGNTTRLGAPVGAAPEVLAVRDDTDAAGKPIPGTGTPMYFNLSLLDLSDLSKGTVITLTAVKADGTPIKGAFFTPSEVTVDTRGPVFSVTEGVTYSQVGAGIKIKAALKKSSNTSPGPGFSAPFDVVDTLRFAKQGEETLTTGFGAGDCTAESTARVCGFVVLPKGIASEEAAVSNGSDQVLFLAGLGGLYEKPAPPATLVLRCDKAYCKGKGVSSYTAKISLLDSEPFVNSPACTTKGVLNDGVHFCTDYVSSHRDNAGDLLLEVLFDKDLRSTM